MCASVAPALVPECCCSPNAQRQHTKIIADVLNGQLMQQLIESQASAVHVGEKLSHTASHVPGACAVLESWSRGPKPQLMLSASRMSLWNAAAVHFEMMRGNSARIKSACAA
jgi:hypothetical protein